MMYLLDTNALIILMFGEVADGKLSNETMNTMLEAEELYLSVVSLWEIAIKIKIGKLRIDNSIKDIVRKCEEEKVKIIPVKIEHLDVTLDLPMINEHKDPFDRLIISTALSEGLKLISTDSKMNSYDIEVLS